MLANQLNNLVQNHKWFQVAGTNGKGSTSHILASILQEAGYTVGLYTSLQLKDYRERIKISGEKISEDFICAFINAHCEFFEANGMSSSEMTFVHGIRF